MHACAHDSHVAILIGAARQLVERKDDWSGTLVLIGQPAEEIGLGAKAMLEDGLFEKFPRPEYVLATHTSILPSKVSAHMAPRRIWAKTPLCSPRKL